MTTDNNEQQGSSSVGPEGGAQHRGGGLGSNPESIREPEQQQQQRPWNAAHGDDAETPQLNAVNQPAGLKKMLDSQVFKQALADNTHENHEDAVHLSDVAARITAEGAQQDGAYEGTFRPGEWDQEDFGVAKSLAREAGVGKEALSAFLKTMVERGAKPAVSEEECVAELQRRWGPAYSERMAKVRQFVGQNRGLLEFLKRSSYGNSVGVAEGVWAHISKSATTQSSLDELVRDPAYLDASHPGHRAAVAKVTTAFSVAFPSNVGRDSDGGVRV